MITASRLKRRITFQRKNPSTDFDGAGSESWTDVATVAAEVEDVLPSRGEKSNGVVNVERRPARIRVRFRKDITADMRIIFGTRVMQITAGPAELGWRNGLELMAEDYSTQGNGN